MFIFIYLAVVFISDVYYINLVSITTRYKDGVVTSRDPRLELLKGNMITDVNQMISTLGLPTSISPEEGVLPSSVVGIDPDFKMLGMDR